ncbi:hypothetical protein DITRI_Ditri17bG0105300 [Diplodiscus trichospermus]
MHVWRKMRRVWLSVAGRLKPHQPTGGASGNGSGLLKLQDDVKMCGYKDVQVMWNLLNTSQLKQIGAATTAVSQSRKCSKQRPSWIAFFWPNQRATASSPSSSSSFCFVKSSKTVNQP